MLKGQDMALAMLYSYVYSSSIAIYPSRGYKKLKNLFYKASRVG